MYAIREDARFIKKNEDGVNKVNRKGEPMFDNKAFLAFIEKETGYKQAAVYNFLRAREAYCNLQDFTHECKKLPEEEGIIRPLATKALNADPERQAEV